MGGRRPPPHGRDVDVIIDHVGGPMLADNIRVMALKARL